MESLDSQYHEVNLSRPIVAVEIITLLDGIRPEQGGLEGPNWGHRAMLLWVDRGGRAKFHVTYVGGASDGMFVPWTSACSDPHCSGGDGGVVQWCISNKFECLRCSKVACPVRVLI